MDVGACPPAASLPRETAPTVSIVVAALNVEAYIEEAIASALAQTYQRLEVVVVNDGSADGTADILDRVLLGRSTGDKAVRVIHQANRGASAARNVGISTSAGELVVFLDGDDRLAPTLVEKSVGLLAADPTLDMVFPWYRHIDSAGRQTGSRSRTSSQRFTFRDIFVKNPIHSCSGVAVRRSALEQAGGFDEHLASNVDFDLWLRISALRSGNVAPIPELLADYRCRPGQLTGSWQRMAENWERVVQKCRTSHPEAVGQLEPTARAHSCLYWSLLARRERDFRNARTLLRRAWTSAPRAMLRSRNAWITTLVTLATFLRTGGPRPGGGARQGRSSLTRNRLL